MACSPCERHVTVCRVAATPTFSSLYLDGVELRRWLAGCWVGGTHTFSSLHLDGVGCRLGLSLPIVLLRPLSWLVVWKYGADCRLVLLIFLAPTPILAETGHALNWHFLQLGRRLLYHSSKVWNICQFIQEVIIFTQCDYLHFYVFLLCFSLIRLNNWTIVISLENIENIEAHEFGRRRE